MQSAAAGPASQVDDGSSGLALCEFHSEVVVGPPLVFDVIQVDEPGICIVEIEFQRVGLQGHHAARQIDLRQQRRPARPSSASRRCGRGLIYMNTLMLPIAFEAVQSLVRGIEST